MLKWLPSLLLGVSLMTAPATLEVPETVPAPEFKHLVRVELGDKSWSTGYVWNRKGRFKPSVTIMQSNEKFMFPGNLYVPPITVDYQCFEVTAGVTVGFGKRK